MSDKKPVVVEFKLGLTGLFVYAAIGILYHLVTGDGPFSWADPWLYVMMFMWPIFLMGWFILAVVAVFAIVFGVAYLGDLKTARRNRAMRKERQKEFEERRRAAAKATLPEGD